MSPQESQTLDIVLNVLRPFARDGAPIEADTQIMELQLIDSAAMVNILLELELRLGIRIAASDLTFDHFQSARILAAQFRRGRDG
jgi:acyl carrier protein